MKNLVQQFSLRTILIAVIIFLVGWQLGHRDAEIRWENYKPSISITSREPPGEVHIDFKLFWDTWDLLFRHHLDKKDLDPQKLFYGAISGMVSAVGDPYTVFLPPDAQKSSKEELNGSFEGVGIQLGFNEDKRLVVVTPLSGTPAERSGIKPKDMILSIDDKDTLNINLPEAVKLIRGPKGTQVALTIMREGDKDPRDFSLTRETIIVKSVEVSYKETPGGKQVAVIKLSRFGERTEDEWKMAVSDIISHNPHGLILDVRNNPGGFLEGAVFIASEFLDSGDVVIQEGAAGRNVYKVSREGGLTKVPMIVLINKGSASASEIVAGALQDRKRAKVVGEKSFGKGTIQEAQDLAEGTGIHITVAKWLTPGGKWVNDTHGLEPDVKVEGEAKDADTHFDDQKKDPVLDEALKILE